MKEKKKRKEKKERTEWSVVNRERRETKRKKSGEEKKKEKKGRVIGGREKESDLTRLVGYSNVCLFTKMPWKLSFDNLKTPKMCFQFS